MSDLIRALGAFAEAPGPEHARIAGALGLERPPTQVEHTELFLFQLYPYASVYLGPEGMLGGEGRDRVAGFWRALELVPPPEPDHLAALLGLYAGLSEVARGDGTDEGRAGSEVGRAGAGVARAALLREHVASWVFPWLDRVMDVGPEPYRAWAGILREVLLEEVRGIDAAGRPARDGDPGGIREGGTRPPLLPLHLREAPPLSDPRDGTRDFLAELLTPVRSGMILTRADLVRAGRERGLGARIGERRYTLEALFGQDPVGMLEWLASEAGDRARRHRALEEELGPTGTFWRERAETAETLLEELAEAARHEGERGPAPSDDTSPSTLAEAGRQ